MKTILFLSLIFVIQTAFPGTYYMSPNGTGDGSSAGSPVGTFSAGMGLVSAGDTLVLLDGEYTQSLNVSKSGARDAHIVIKAGNVGGAFINGENVRIPITIWQKSWIHFDGIKAGNSNEHVYHLLYADHLKITRCAGFNAGGAKDPDANFHIFEIAYSDSAFAEDIWGWGTGRYTCTFYGCSNSHIRRGLFRPGLYSRCPHAGLAIYCTDHTLTENVIVFESRVDPTSTYGGTEPWKLITGGFVCEGHDCPNTKSSKDNRHYGCIAIDNGEHWDVTPRSQPAGCFVWNEFQGLRQLHGHFCGTHALPGGRSLKYREQYESQHSQALRGWCNHKPGPLAMALRRYHQDGHGHERDHYRIRAAAARSLYRYSPGIC
jgi:hypothetical protein